MHRIKINAPHHGTHAPVRLNVNGRKSEHQVNAEIPVDDDQLSALRDSGYDITEIEIDDTAVEEAPAPGDSGGAGDAGAGGAASGGSASGETSDETPAVTIPEGFLDRSINAIAAELADKDAAFLAQLRKDEETGKTRAGLFKAIDERLTALAQA